MEGVNQEGLEFGGAELRRQNLRGDLDDNTRVFDIGSPSSGKGTKTNMEGKWKGFVPRGWRFC
eukprot:9427625-Karenia_brevis.AAC.1